VNRQKVFDSGVPLLLKLKVSENSNSKCAPRITKKKGDGYLRHCAQSLKRIARLSDKDVKRFFVLCEGL